MPIVAEQFKHVIGVDTHARTHTFVVMATDTTRVVEEKTFPTSPAGLRRALSWMCRSCPQGFLAAVEGTSSYGATLAGLLADAGITVVEARPPKRLGRRQGKSDAIDALAAARAVLALDVDRLPTPRAGKIRSALRVLLTARRSIDQARSADRNALNALVRTIDVGVDARKPLTDAQLRAIGAWRTRSSDDVEIATARAEAQRLARSVLNANDQLVENFKLLSTHVRELAPHLLDKPGIGPVSAARFLTAWSHAGRVHSEAAFAALAGASPLPASSGNTSRHRLNRGGDRHLNSALDVVARSRMQHDPQTRAYVERRTTEGKTIREIRRILKRYIARQIYRSLQTT